MKLKVIIPASEIPDGSIVTKRTGEKHYVLHRKIIFYDEHKTPQIIKAESGGVLLCQIPFEATCNAYPGNTLFGWIVEEEELYDFLSLRIQLYG